MEFRVLGPVEVLDGGRPVLINTPRLRMLLAALLLRANQHLSLDELTDTLWGEQLPANPRAALQSLISRLRRLVPEVGRRIVTRELAYQLIVNDDEVDLLRFRGYVARAREESDPAARLPLLTAAIDQWRGEPLAGLSTGLMVRNHVSRLVEERLHVTEELLTDRLQLGHHVELVAELSALVVAQPERERLWALLITSLYRCGRQADALAAYQQLHGYLRDHLGLEPGTDLRALHHAILVQDPMLDGDRSDPAADPLQRITRPRELPADLDRFLGRGEELAALNRLLSDDPSTDRAGSDHAQQARPRRSTVIAALDGTAGVGKTALAVHWAHRIGDRFPDGQLFLNLRGYGPTRPMPPTEAIEMMLRSLGTPADQIPVGLDARSALLRTMLAGKRMLVLLDNARDADQVRPLLPGSGCLVLITSRSQLRGLSVREGARRIAVDQLSESESTELLRYGLGVRADAEPATVAALVRLCGRLPLALALATDHANRNADRPLAALIAELREERDRLNLFADVGDPASDLRVVFSWSYRALAQDAARTFRLLGIAPGPDISVLATAALVGVEVADARRLLDQLLQASLVQCRRPGRYEIHDLLRSYALELAERLDTLEHRRGAIHRLLRWYLHSALEARAMLQPSETSVGPVPGPRLPEPEPFRTGRDALSWYTAEQDNLVDSVRMAHQVRYDDLCWRLAYALWVYLQSYRAWEPILETHDLGLRSARRCAERSGEAHMLDGMGVALRGAGLPGDAARRQHEALELFRAVSDRNGEATALSNLGVSYRCLGQYRDSLAFAHRALVLDRQHDERGNMAISLMQIAQTLTAAKQADAAIEPATEALGLMQSTGRGRGEARALQVLAEAHAEVRDHDAAIARCAEATVIYADLDDRWSHAAALIQLGDLQEAARRPAAARASWRHALAVLDRLGAPDTSDVRGRLAVTVERTEDGHRASNADAQ